MRKLFKREPPLRLVVGLGYAVPKIMRALEDDLRRAGFPKHFLCDIEINNDAVVITLKEDLT